MKETKVVYMIYRYRSCRSKDKQYKQYKQRVKRQTLHRKLKPSKTQWVHSGNLNLYT